MAAISSGPLARPCTRCHGGFALWLKFLAISAVCKKFSCQRYGCARWTAYASDVGQIPLPPRSQTQNNEDSSAVERGLPSCGRRGSGKSWPSHFRSPSLRLAQCFSRGSFGCPVFFERREAECFYFKNTGWRDIMPLVFLYAQVRLLSFFRKCFLSVQVK